ncbi:SCO1664 family protein [Nocardioides sp. Kera G14]|uniref:SCO1664 family protein n=1 Tax=Nocardioides sp. Kera G14 TaxID=2884264 RepID=UPI001D123DC7|nr:SCO1664 family protein [Nocardioides sp. Kera G14]UDY25175.1 SCO1664 family protein [Nocardioides sp. Kera G14]
MIPEPTLDLVSGELELVGRVTSASNHTYVATLGELQVAYKPISGEKPLWDFPDGRLAYREVAARLLSEATGWNVVPPTVLRDGPRGEGMVQLWCEPDPAQDAVTIVPAGQHRDGFRHVFDGVGYDDRPVSLIHEDSQPLRRMAIFDVLANNADRKGGHVLEMPDGHRFGIDHGICFHSEPKLRTVLWGWAGEPLTEDELVVVRRVRAALDGELGAELCFWLSAWDLEALVARADRLLGTGTMPVPGVGWPSIPWPPF